MSVTAPDRIRVLVVDDSVAVRRLLTSLLAADPQIEVVGTAADGRAALAAIDTLRPDVVTMDVEMPVLDGLATLRELRKVHRTMPVIMLSTLTIRGAESTLDALTSGANDYVPKPTNVSDRGAALEGIRSSLLPKIKSLHAKYVAARPGGGAASHAPAPIVAPAALPKRAASAAVVPFPGAARGAPADVVAIGVSTGGPNALALVLPALPADFPVPILIAQHIPPVFSAVLAERLTAASKIRVVECRGGERLAPGFAYIAPGQKHMVVTGSRSEPRLMLNEDPPENSCRPSVDVLFRSVAAMYGRALLGVVLTGMGQDGLEGCKLMKQGGASVIVQDEASSVVWGMPGFVWKAGLADGVYPLNEMAAAIGARVNKIRPPRAMSGG